MKKLLLVIILSILLIGIVSAVDFDPAADINMKGRWSLKNVTNITITGSNNVTVNNTGFWGTIFWSKLSGIPSYIIDWSPAITGNRTASETNTNTAILNNRTQIEINTNSAINGNISKVNLAINNNISQVNQAITGNTSNLNSAIINNISNVRIDINNNYTSLNNSKLNQIDQRYNDTSYISNVNSTLYSWVDTFFLRIDDMFSKSEIINMINGNWTDLNNSKLDKNDQRYNDTQYIDDINSSLDNKINGKLDITDQRYNDTSYIDQIVTNNNESWSRTDNSTYSQTTSDVNNNRSKWFNNETFNQSLTDDLYEHNGSVSSMNISITSWVNTYFLKITDMFTKQNIIDMISGNRTEIETNTNNAINGNSSMIRNDINNNITMVNTNIGNNWTDLNNSKLDKTDQRYNETDLILGINSTTNLRIDAWGGVHNGTDGTNGTNGINGTNGVDGINGTGFYVNFTDDTVCSNGGYNYSGYTLIEGVYVLNWSSVICNGQNGSQGISGVNGTNGIDGINGTNAYNITNNITIENNITNNITIENNITTINNITNNITNNIITYEMNYTDVALTNQSTSWGIYNLTSSYINAFLEWSNLKNIPSYVKDWDYKLNQTDQRYNETVLASDKYNVTYAVTSGDVTANRSNFLTTFNTTYAATTSQWNGNSSTLIGCINNVSYLDRSNTTYAATTTQWDGNKTVLIGCVNNASYLSTYNVTYDVVDKEWDGNKTALIGTINNASYLTTYNVTYHGLINNASYLSTFNTTYATWLPNYTASKIYWYNYSTIDQAYTNTVNNSLASWVDTFFLRISEIYTNLQITGMISGNVSNVRTDINNNYTSSISISSTMISQNRTAINTAITGNATNLTTYINTRDGTADLHTHKLNNLSNGNLTINLPMNTNNITQVSYITFAKITGACSLTLNGSICRNASGIYIVSGS